MIQWTLSIKIFKILEVKKKKFPGYEKKLFSHFLELVGPLCEVGARDNLSPLYVLVIEYDSNCTFN